MFLCSCFSCLEKKTDALYNLFNKFCVGFMKDSSDCLSTLSTSLDLLQELISSEEEEQIGLPPRTHLMSVQELACVLNWNKQVPSEPEEESKETVTTTENPPEEEPMEECEKEEKEETVEVKENDVEMKEVEEETPKKKHPILALEKLLQVSL